MNVEAWTVPQFGLWYQRDWSRNEHVRDESKGVFMRFFGSTLSGSVVSKGFCYRYHEHISTKSRMGRSPYDQMLYQDK